MVPAGVAGAVSLEEYVKELLVGRFRKEVVNVDEIYESILCLNWAMSDCREAGGGSECSVFANDCYRRIYEGYGLKYYPLSFVATDGMGTNGFLGPMYPVMVGGFNAVLVPLRLPGKDEEEVAGAAFTWVYRKFMPHKIDYLIDETNAFAPWQYANPRVKKVHKILTRIKEEVPAFTERVLERDEVRIIGRIILDELPEARGIVVVVGGFYWPNTRESVNLLTLLENLIRYEPDESYRLFRAFIPPLLKYKVREGVYSSSIVSIIFVRDLEDAYDELMTWLNLFHGRTYYKITGEMPTILHVEGNFFKELAAIPHYVEPIARGVRVLADVLMRTKYIGRAVRVAEWASRVAGWIDDVLVATRAARMALHAELAELPAAQLVLALIDLVDVVWHYDEYAQEVRRAMRELRQFARPLIINIERGLRLIEERFEEVFKEVYKFIR